MTDRVLKAAALLCFVIFLFTLGQRMVTPVLKDLKGWVPQSKEKLSSSATPSSPVSSQTPYDAKYTVFINGKPYTQSQTISPSLPIKAYFEHSDPRIIKVKMQHPQNSSLRIYYPLGKEVLIKNHSVMMERGILSHSDFIAVDKQGKEYEKIRLVFKPGR